MSGSVVLLLTFRNDTYGSVPHFLFFLCSAFPTPFVFSAEYYVTYDSDQEITSRGKENMGIVKFTVRTPICNLAAQDIDVTRGIR